MARQKPIEIINPPNMLKVKIGGAMPTLDQQAIARAEQALAKLSSQFGEWIVEEVDRLLDAWREFEAVGDTKETREGLHRRAHDLKSLAPTYGYPLVGRVAGSLSRLVGEEGDGVVYPIALLKAHVDGVRAIVRGKITAADHPVGVALAEELETRAFEVLPRKT